MDYANIKSEHIKLKRYFDQTMNYSPPRSRNPSNQMRKLQSSIQKGQSYIANERILLDDLDSSKDIKDLLENRLNKNASMNNEKQYNENSFEGSFEQLKRKTPTHTSQKQKLITNMSEISQIIGSNINKAKNKINNVNNINNNSNTSNISGGNYSNLMHPNSFSTGKDIDIMINNNSKDIIDNYIDKNRERDLINVRDQRDKTYKEDNNNLVMNKINANNIATNNVNKNVNNVNNVNNIRNDKFAKNIKHNSAVDRNSKNTLKGILISPTNKISPSKKNTANNMNTLNKLNNMNNTNTKNNISNMNRINTNTNTNNNINNLNRNRISTKSNNNIKQVIDQNISQEIAKQTNNNLNPNNNSPTNININIDEINNSGINNPFRANIEHILTQNKEEKLIDTPTKVKQINSKSKSKSKSKKQVSSRKSLISSTSGMSSTFAHSNIKHENLNNHSSKFGRKSLVSSISGMSSEVENKVDQRHINNSNEKYIKMAYNSVKRKENKSCNKVGNRLTIDLYNHGEGEHSDHPDQSGPDNHSDHGEHCENNKHNHNRKHKPKNHHPYTNSYLSNYLNKSNNHDTNKLCIKCVTREKSKNKKAIYGTTNNSNNSLSLKELAHNIQKIKSIIRPTQQYAFKE